MIPKIIHYCWFGGRPLTKEVKTYIDTWQEFFPDFEMKRWDESNFDVNSLEYTRQAYFAKKYAFVSDVVRLHALASEGGLYFDTDILIKRPFPMEWFELDGFGSFEHDKFVQTGIIGASKGNPFITEFLNTYKARQFFKGIKFDLTTNVSVFSTLMSNHGFKMNNTLQEISGFRIFPQIYLCGKDWIKGRYDNESTYAVHDYAGTWGKEVLSSVLRFKIKSFITILRWRIRNR